MVKDDLRVYEIDKLGLTRLCDDSDENLIVVDDNGLGLWEIKSKGKQVQAELLDVFKNCNYKRIRLHDVGFGKVILHKNFCIANFHTSSHSGFLRLINVDTGQSKNLPGQFYGTKFDDELFVQDFKKNLYCFDTDLNQRWKVSLPPNLRTDYPSMPERYINPFLCGSNIVINAGVDPRKRSDGKIIAFSQKDGSTVWEYDVDSLPSSIYLIDDKFYITHCGDIIVLDGNTGETILQEPSGFEEYIAVYPFKDLLFCFSQPKGILKIFSSDAKRVVQELEFPSSYYPSYQHGIVTKDDYLYT